MPGRWRRVLLLSGLAAMAVAGVLLSRSGWLFADSSPIRNALEAMSWLAAIATLAGTALPPVWRWFSNDRSTAPIELRTGSTGLAGHALHLVEGRLPAVSEVGLLELGVKPAMDTDSDADLPPFVSRDRDEDLEWAITRGGMVLLHGRAASGKSRAALEVLRRLRPHHQLLVPCDGPALRALTESEVDFTDTVVWLDDLERFLTPDGLDFGLLQRLCPHGSTTTIVATMRDEELAHYDHASTAGTDEAVGITRNAVELLEQLRGQRRLHLERHLSETERESAANQPDHRIHAALEAEEGFAEYLAAGRAMLGRWSTGDGDLFHVGQALLSAAVDCRRAGYHQPIPNRVLEDLHHRYLAPGWRHRADLPPATNGLTWACKRVLGASSCLQPRSHNTYLAADYLLDSTDAASSPLKDTTIYPETWNAVLSLATPAEAVAIGNTAYNAKNLPMAEKAFRNGAEAGDSMAMFSLGTLLAERGDEHEAEAWYRKAAETGSRWAMHNLGLLLARRGDEHEAEVWYRQAIEAGSRSAIHNLSLLEKRGGREEDEIWYRNAEAEEHVSANRMDALFKEQSGDDAPP